MQSLEDELSAYFTARAAPAIASVYLHGSHAEGRAHRESDVDVAVLVDRAMLPTPRQRFDLRVELSAELLSALQQREVDVVILNDVPPGLGRAAITRGRRVYCSRPDLDHAFVRDVQLRAADVDLFLRRMRKIKLEALRK